MAGAVALATGAVGWLAGTRVQSPADAAAAHKAPAASLITVAVESQTLTATVNAQGTVAYGTPQPLTLTGSVATTDANAAPLITKVPVANHTVHEGDVLLEVSGRPVLVMTGKVPMYRTLARGSSGDDVNQLRAALRRLLPSRHVARTGAIDDGVMNAVKAWYVTRGYQAAQQPDTTTTPQTYDVSIPSGEILFLPRLPARLVTVTVKTGAPASGVIGTVADPALVVNGTVSPDDATLLKVGMAATLVHPDGDTFPATLTVMGAAAAVENTDDDSDKSDPSVSGTPIRLSPKSPAKLAAFTGQALKVTIRVGGTGHAVLSVPVAAVFTASDGQARVSVQDPTGTVRDVPVTPGLSTGGYVQITPRTSGQLKAGDRVVVGSR